MPSSNLNDCSDNFQPPTSVGAGKPESPTSVGADSSKPPTSVGAGNSDSKPPTSVGAGKPPTSVGAGESMPPTSVGAGEVRHGMCDPKPTFSMTQKRRQNAQLSMSNPSDPMQAFMQMMMERKEEKER